AHRALVDAGLLRDRAGGHVEAVAGPARLDPQALSGLLGHGLDAERLADGVSVGGVADHIDAEVGGHVDAVLALHERVLLLGGGGVERLARIRSDEREDRALGAHVDALHVTAEAVRAHVLEQRGQSHLLAVDPHRVGQAQHAHVGQELGLVIEQRCVAASPRLERLDVIGHLPLQELQRLRAGELELAALRTIHQPDRLPETFVFGRRDHGSIVGTGRPDTVRGRGAGRRLSGGARHAAARLDPVQPGPADLRRGPLHRGGDPARADQRAAVLEERLALADPRGARVRPRRGGRDGARNAGAARPGGHRWRAPRARRARGPGGGRADVGPARVGPARVRAAAQPVVARIALLSSDLLFGSKVQGGLQAVGHEVTMARGADPEADLLVVDLVTSSYDDDELASLGSAGVVLGFYAHTDQEIRRRAEDAGFDLVVPRSRMAREMTSLVDRLVPA